MMAGPGDVVAEGKRREQQQAGQRYLGSFLSTDLTTQYRRWERWAYAERHPLGAGNDERALKVGRCYGPTCRCCGGGGPSCGLYNAQGRREEEGKKSTAPADWREAEGSFDPGTLLRVLWGRARGSDGGARGIGGKVLGRTTCLAPPTPTCRQGRRRFNGSKQHIGCVILVASEPSTRGYG